MKVATVSRTGNAISLRLLALSGVVGPLIYASVVAVLGRLYLGYSHLSQTMSELGATNAPHALIMNLAGLGLLGVMTMAFAAGLRQGIGHGGSATFGTVLIAASGASLVMTAVFPCDTGGQITTAGQVHGAFAIMGAVCMVIGMLIISLALPRDSRWQRYAVFSVLIALLASLLGGLHGFDVIEGWKGALQRLSMGVGLLWMVVMSFKLLRLPQSGTETS